MENKEIEIFKKYFIGSVSEEFNTTKKVISAVTHNNPQYRPDPKSKTALEIAWHIAASELWFLQGILNGEFGSSEVKMPENMKSGEDIAQWYEKNILPEIENVKNMSPEATQRPTDFFGLMQLPAIMYLDFLIKHSVHHRGQLSSYLRAIGGKVPNIYGGSADEPFSM